MHTAADSSTDLISSPSATDDRNASTKAAGFVEQADKGPLSEIVHNSSAASLSTSTTDVAVIIGGSSSIYELRSKRSRRLVLLVTAVAALLVPLTDTIYLPALPAVGRDLHASETAVAATVSVFLFAVGLGNVFWGPFSDRFGRRLTYNLSAVIFVGTTLGCIFSPSIGVLTAMRALQGFAQCSFLTTGQAVVADIFPPEVRGSAFGLFMLSVLIGPVVAPMIGGALSAALGWRATFVFLAIFCGVVSALLLIFLPETHQHLVLKRLGKKDAARLQLVTEAATVLAIKPVFHPPWGLLKYIYAPRFAPFVLSNAWAIASVFAGLTVWPVYAAEPPYSLNQAMVGVTYVVCGVGLFFGSLAAGRASDKAAVLFARAPEGRTVFSLVFSAATMPVGLLLFGWALHAQSHLAVVLLATFFLGFGTSSIQPGVYSYVSCVDQSKAGSATAAVNAAWCIIAAVVVLVSVPGVQSLGVGGYFTLLAGIHLLLVGTAGAVVFHKLRQPGSSTP